MGKRKKAKKEANKAAGVPIRGKGEKRNPPKKSAGKKKKKKKGKGKGKKSVFQKAKKTANQAAKLAGKNVESGKKVGDQLVEGTGITDGEFLDREESTRDEEVDNAFGNLEADRDRALTDSDDMKFALDELRRKSEGFSLQEKEQLKFDQVNQLNSQLSTGLRGAQAFGLGRNISGGFRGSAFVPVLNQAIQSRRGIENDILLAEQASRAEALGKFTDTVGTRDQNRANNLLNIGESEQGLISADRLHNQSIQEFNAQQKAKEIAARVAKNATGLGIVQDTSDTLNQDKLLNTQLSTSQENLDNLLSLA